MRRPVDDSYRLLACRYIREQLRVLGRQLKGARAGEDVECVHQARVASRRLRAGLRLFRDCFAAREVKAWRKEIRRVTRDLGTARDKDVQIAFVRDFLSRVQDRAHRPGLRRLLLRLAQQRAAAQPQVIKAAERLQRSGVLLEMRTGTRAASSGLKAEGVQSLFVFRVAEGQILGAVASLRAYEDSLDDPEDKQRHHEMRIEAKRLRYTLEICEPVYEGRLAEPIETAKRVQTLLGEIHDCDVWIDDLEAFLGEERERTEEYYGHTRPMRRLKGGIEHLRRERRRCRGQRFRELNRYWRKRKAERFWGKLTRLVRSRREKAERIELAETQASAPPPPEAEAQKTVEEGDTAQRQAPSRHP